MKTVEDVLMSAGVLRVEGVEARGVHDEVDAIQTLSSNGGGLHAEALGMESADGPGRSRPGLLPPRLDARPRVWDGLAALRLLLVYKDVRDRAAMEGELQAQLREIESIQRGREE